MRFLIIASTVLFLSGCNKKPPAFQNYLHMTLDGAKIECDRNISASSYVSITPNQVQKMSIVGYWTTSSIENGNIEIELYDFNNTIGQKELLSPSVVTVMINHTMGNLLSTDTYYGGGSEAKINITEVNERFIKGSFQFVVKMVTGPNVFVTKNVTGDFHIKR
jgi:hypothetical protein